MINNFNFHGTVNINFGCKHCSHNNDSNCGAFIHTMTLDFENNLLIFNIAGTIGTHVNMTLTPEGGNPVITDCAPIGDTYSMSIDTFGSILGGNGTIALNAYSDECTTLLCSESFPFYTNQIEVPTEGDDLIVNPSGTPSCNSNLIYTELLNGVGGGNTMYSCNGNQCVEDQNGQYNDSKCYGNCQVPPTMYSCDLGNCVEDENGEYNNDNCNGQCVLMYSCNGNDCVPDNDGTYFTSNCDWACEEPVLLGFIEFNDIANSPVPGNSAHDWSNYVGNYQAFTSTVIIANKIEFYGIPILNTQLLFYNITLVDYDFSGFTYITYLYFNNVIGVTAIDNISITVEYLSLNNVDIVNLDLSVLVNLVSLMVNNSPTITSINIDNSILLENIQLFNIPLVTEIDFTNNLALTSLSIEIHGLTSIDITLNTALEYLRVYNNSNYIINSIDLSNNINLSHIDIVGTNIVSLDITGLDLTMLDVHDNPLLAAIDLTGAPNLNSFIGNNTAITAIDTSNNPLLFYLNINRTPIIAIDTSFNIVLGVLDLSHCSSLATYVFSSSIYLLSFFELPQFTTVDISACVNLLTFDGSLTPLSNIDITNNPLLNNIRLFAGAISDVNNINALLAYLVSINYTGYLDISGGTHAAPTGQGILDVATLIGNGATVITN